MINRFKKNGDVSEKDSTEKNIPVEIIIDQVRYKFAYFISHQGRKLASGHYIFGDYSNKIIINNDTTR